MAQQNVLQENIQEAAFHLKVMLEGRCPRIGIILGSGLGDLAKQLKESVSIPFRDVPHMKTATATSHVGQFVCGKLGDVTVLVMQGRLHGYEGNSPQEVAFPVWVMKEAGIDTMLTTNAAGAINESFAVGDFCMMTDHINFTGRNPVAGVEPDGIAFRFFSMMDAYDPALRAAAQKVAEEMSFPLRQGVYLGLLGPSFETPAEIRAFRNWGADTVAMSVCEEVIAARHVGLRVFGISLISNMACGIEGSSPNDVEVLEVAARQVPLFCEFMLRFVDVISKR